MKQCLIVVITHQLGVEPWASAERSLYQSMSPVLPIEETIQGAKCENLEKVVVGDDPKKFFRSGLNYLLKRRKS